MAGFVYGAWGIAVAAIGDTLPGEIALPTFPSRLLGPIGGAVLILRMLMRMAETGAALRRGEMASHVQPGAH